MRSRQVVAVVLKDVLCELAQDQATLESVLATEGMRSTQKLSSFPQAELASKLKLAPSVVVLVSGTAFNKKTLELDAKTKIDAVNKSAAQYGVTPGQTLAEARALVAHLKLSVVNEGELRCALERVTDALACFGTTVALELPDVVWIDVTGSTHLFGGEEALLDEIGAVVEELGHRVRIALSDGPRLACAFARWETRRRGKMAVVVTPEQKEACLKALPITSLQLEQDVVIGLAQLGLLSAADLLAVDSKLMSSRLGSRAMKALSLLRGEDAEPLNAHRPQVLPCETLMWDEPLNGTDPVLFALRRLTTQIAARLRGRGLAAEALQLTLKHDPGIARFRGKSSYSQYQLKLSAPLSRAEDLCRILTARVNKIQLDVPNVGIELKVLSTAHCTQRQLDLAVGFSKLDAGDPERMAVLFGELAADIGTQNFGVLRMANTHKPEKITLLSPLEDLTPKKRSVSRARRKPHRAEGIGTPGHLSIGDWSGTNHPGIDGGGIGPHRAGSNRTSSHPSNRAGSNKPPSRLLPIPMLVNVPFRTGELMPLGQQLYEIKRVIFEHRLDAVEWWSHEPCSRDYLRLWLSSHQGELQVLGFIDRITQRRYVQGWYD